MINQKGHSFILGIFVGALIISALVAVYYFETQKNSNLDLQSLPSITTNNPSPIAATTPNPVESWKTYNVEKYGASFRYPSDYEIEIKNDVEAQMLLSIKGPAEEYSLDIGPIGKVPGSGLVYSNYPPYSRAEGTKVFNNRTWEIIPASGFGDAGMTFSSGQKYQIDNGKNRFDFELIKPKESSSTYEKVISSFEFINL